MKELDKLTKSKKFKSTLEFAIFQTRLSKHIYEARKELGLSQKELAERAGTTQRIISEIESGDYKLSEMLYRLFRALDKSLICDGADLIKGKKVGAGSRIYRVTSGADIMAEGE
jgi:transcriptional regulator with XRE-family HTH domain